MLSVHVSLRARTHAKRIMAACNQITTMIHLPQTEEQIIGSLLGRALLTANQSINQSINEMKWKPSNLTVIVQESSGVGVDVGVF